MKFARRMLFKYLLMKKFLLWALLALTSMPAVAVLDGDGYYRVQNAETKRYAYLIDDKGSFNTSTTSADVNALELYSGFQNASSDPATVFFVSKVPVGGLDHNVAGQGTSLYDFLDTYLKIMNGKVYDGIQSYYAYASRSGFTKYLGDLQNEDVEQGFPSVDCQGDERLWYINPVSADDEQGYFGIAPTVTVGNKYYHPFFAAFPYSAKSEGVKFYAVVKVDSRVKAVVISELAGVIPAGVPVIVECAAPLASGNRLNVGASGSSSDVSANLLKGVYFNSGKFKHVNQLPFDKTSMRVLASKDGKLVFTTADYYFVPRNQAYLSLSGADVDVDTYQVVTPEEYENMSSVEGIIADDANVDVYGIDGTLIKSGIGRSEVSSIGKGVYILRSGNSVERIILH